MVVRTLTFGCVGLALLLLLVFTAGNGQACNQV